MMTINPDSSERRPVLSPESSGKESMHARIKVIVAGADANPLAGKPWWDMLRAVGFDVQILNGAIEGLWQLRSDPGDLLIVDGSVSDLPPAGVVDALRMDDRTRHLPLILVEPPDGMPREDLVHVITRATAPEEVVALVEDVLTTSSASRLLRAPALELSVLKTAADQLAAGRSFPAFAGLMANELRARVGVGWVRFWRRDAERGTWILSVQEGAVREPNVQLVEMVAHGSRAYVHRDEQGDVVSVPILVGERVESVIQLGDTARALTDPKALAERLSLLLGLALARENETEEWAKTSRELDLYYEMAHATRYTLTIEHMARFALESLHRVIDYDVAGLLVLGEPANLTLRRHRGVQDELVERARSHILTTLRINSGLDLGDDVETVVDVVDAPARAAPDKLRSFVNVPLTLGGSLSGLIHVSSTRENAFRDRDVALLNRLSSVVVSSIQGARDVLAAVQSRIERMVEHMTDGVLMLDGRGEVIAINASARAILKLSGPVTTRIRLSEVVPALGFDPLSLMASERKSLRRLVWVDASAYQAQLSPVEDSQGALAGVVVAFRNFTEEKRLDDMKSEFINIVSHELRSPLEAVQNAISLVLSPSLGGLTERQARFLELARGGVEHLLGVVSELRELSKLEAGKTRIVLTPIDVAEPIRTVQARLQARADEKRIRFEARIDDEMPSVYGETALIEKILTSLVGNALKFTPPGGAVDVEARATWEEWGSARRRAVAVTVRDTGPGIPKEQLESIFDKFQRLGRGPGDSSYCVGAPPPTRWAEGSSGTGFGLPMGLPMIREVVSAHHGRIWAESELGRGSRLTFIIPVLSEGELFLRSLDREVDRARRVPAPLALVLLRLRDRERLLKELGSEEYEALLREMDSCAQRTIRRSTDRIELRRDKGEIAALLLDTPQLGGEAFGQRLGEELRRLASRAGVHFEIARGCAVFPEDAATAARLYELAGDRALGRA